MERAGGEKANVQYRRFYIQGNRRQFRIVVLDGFEDDPCLHIGDSMHGASFGNQGLEII